MLYALLVGNLDTTGTSVLSQKVVFSVRRKPHISTRFVDSATPGLGFYHLDIPDVNSQHLDSLKNVSIVYIEFGDITKHELSKEFADIYQTNWPWPINALDEWTFLVKFPPKILAE